MRSRPILAMVILAAAVLMLGACPGFGDDPPITVTVSRGFNSYDATVGSTGGEFKITTGWTGYVDPHIHHYDIDHRDAYNDSTLDFATFCVQRSEYLQYGGTYDVALADGTNLNKPLDDGAAALYKLWYMGKLSAYNYPDDGGTRSTDAMYVQRLIWWRMGEFGSPDDEAADLDITDEKYVGWYNYAKTMGEAQAGDQGVQVMVLSGGPPGDGANQDLLVLTVNGSIPRIPEPGSIALLATGGLGMLPLLRRRRTT